MRAARSLGDRLLLISFVAMITLVLVGLATSSSTGANFTGTSTNPTNHINTLNVQPPASQSATTSSSAGVVNLSWTATPTAPGTGHTLSYLVLRGPVGGPYTQVATTSSLSYSDTPASDGTYEYVIEARVTGGGSFTSADSAARSGVSDRTAPTKAITCNGAACSATSWYNAAVSVTVSGTDSGAGMGSVTRNVDAGGQTSTAGASATFTVSGDSAAHSVVYFTTDAAGNASSSATQTLKIDATAPTTVTGLTSARGASTGQVNLSWTAATDATSGVAGYTLRRSNSITTGVCPAANTTNYPNTQSVAVGTSFVATAPSGNDYCFYMVTNDNAGNVSANSAVTGPTRAR